MCFYPVTKGWILTSSAYYYVRIQSINLSISVESTSYVFLPNGKFLPCDDGLNFDINQSTFSVFVSSFFCLFGDVAFSELFLYHSRFSLNGEYVVHSLLPNGVFLPCNQGLDFLH